MGRFYETTPAKYVDDLMYDLPYDEISKLIKEKQTTAQNAIDDTLGLSKDVVITPIQNSETDVNIAREEHEKLNGSVNDLVQKIKEDAANAHIYEREINDLKVGLNENVTSGNIYKINANYKERELRRKTLLDKAEKDGLNAEEVQRLLAFNDLSYIDKGGVMEDGNYNQYQFENLTETENITKHGENIFKDMMGKDFEKIRQTDNGYVDIETGKKWEGFDEKRINEAVNIYMASTKDLTGRMSQLHKLGLEDTPEKQAEKFTQFMQNKYGKHQVKDEYRNKIGAIATADANRENQAAFENEQEMNATPVIAVETVASNLPKTETSLQKNINDLVVSANNLRQQSLVHGKAIVANAGDSLTKREKELLLAGDTQTVNRFLASSGMTQEAQKEYKKTATELNWKKNYYNKVKENYLEVKKQKGKDYSYADYMADPQFGLSSEDYNAGMASATWQGIDVPKNVKLGDVIKRVNTALTGDAVPVDLRTATMQTVVPGKNGTPKVVGTAYFAEPSSSDYQHASKGSYIVTLENGKKQIVTAAQIGPNTVLAPGKRLGANGPKIKSVAIPLQGNKGMTGTFGQMRDNFAKVSGSTSKAESDAIGTKVGTSKYIQEGASADNEDASTTLDASPSNVKNNNGEYFWNVKGKMGNNSFTYHSPMGNKHAGAVTSPIVQKGRYEKVGYEENANATLSQLRLPVKMISIKGSDNGAQIEIKRGKIFINGQEHSVSSEEGKRIVHDYYMAKEGANSINWELE